MVVEPIGAPRRADGDARESRGRSHPADTSRVTLGHQANPMRDTELCHDMISRRRWWTEAPA
jgi:hypothetical protein